MCLQHPLISFYWCDLRQTCLINNFHFRYPHFLRSFWVSFLLKVLHFLSFCFPPGEASFRSLSLLKTINACRNLIMGLFGWFLNFFLLKTRSSFIKIWFLTTKHHIQNFGAIYHLLKIWFEKFDSFLKFRNIKRCFLTSFWNLSS